VSELSELYDRNLARWREDPAKVRREAPLLAFAFEAAEPKTNLEAELQQVRGRLAKTVESYEAQVRGLRGTVAAKERDHADSDAHTAQRLADGARRIAELEGELSEARRHAPVLALATFADGEQEQLSALGWRKGTCAID
jgi:hypothetical protein